MKKIFAINSVNYASTGRIMMDIADLARDRGYDVITCSAVNHAKQDIKNHLWISGKFSRAISMRLAKITGLNGMFSWFATLRLLRNLKKFNPDIIHLHNLHNNYVNLPMLFKYIKKHNVKVVWTLHDCWTFTGHCPYYTIENCEKWKTDCHKCPSYKKYPVSLIDRSRYIHKKKKKWFSGIKTARLITPSDWLKREVEQSFLSQYPAQTINNGVNLDIFKPQNNDIRKIYCCDNKFIILGVAFSWGRKKGLDVFIELSNRLDKSKYQIILVGTDDDVDKLLPDGIISIHRTKNQIELAKIYTSANLFVNPTREENYPTVNMEAIACGVPVLTFRTGGSPEIPDTSCGSVVDYNDIDGLYSEIIRICEKKPYSSEDCVNRAKTFNIVEKYEEYIKVYNELLSVDER